jgi:hypothetical protein
MTIRNLFPKKLLFATRTSRNRFANTPKNSTVPLHTTGHLARMPKSSPKNPQSPLPAKRSWLRRVASFLSPSAKTSAAPEKPRNKTSPTAPAAAPTADLPPFAGLPPDRIYVPHTQAECEAAARDILAAGVAGFDTEARPTFRVGEKSTGPHVVQFALADRAYIFQLNRPATIPIVADLLASDRVLKVGFGLKNDHSQIRHRFGVPLHHVLDLDQTFRKRGHRDQIGVRRAIAEVLHQSFRKSRSITTSNWNAQELTPSQLRYAANDAFAALKVMEALQLTSADIHNQHLPRKAKPHRTKKS